MGSIGSKLPDLSEVELVTINNSFMEIVTNVSHFYFELLIYYVSVSADLLSKKADTPSFEQEHEPYVAPAAQDSSFGDYQKLLTLMESGNCNRLTIL